MKWLIHFLFRKRTKESPEQQKARQLIKAIEQGGIPTDPILVNKVGRSLGLEISPSAPMEQTIERIAQILASGK
jgi:hypothetical protein